jgi:rSAM/selenodomain-associated transferase 2
VRLAIPAQQRSLCVTVFPKRGTESSDVCRSLAVIIPALNEARLLPGVIAGVTAAAQGADIEIIVADGGSDDGTAEAARGAGARVVAAARGRARQLNAGAAAASAGILLFLHADTRLPDGFPKLVREALSVPGVVAGAFRLEFAAAARGIRAVQHLANFRSRFLQMPYGDQALFLPAARFRALGGFPDMPLMEDFELVRRLRRQGRVVTLAASVRTSARRLERLGPLRATLINQAIIAAYFAGVSPARLAAWYRGMR